MNFFKLHGFYNFYSPFSLGSVCNSITFHANCQELNAQFLANNSAAFVRFYRVSGISYHCSGAQTVLPHGFGGFGETRPFLAADRHNISVTYLLHLVSGYPCAACGAKLCGICPEDML